MKITGSIKVITIIFLDFILLMAIFHDGIISIVVVAAVSIYIYFGGYAALLKDNAVYSNKLPELERHRLELAKEQLLDDVKRVSKLNIRGVKLYLVPGDGRLQATAYGANCISISRGMLDNTDPISMNAIIAHEISHTVCFDPESSRAVFSFIVLIMLLLSCMSYAVIFIISLIFLLLDLFQSWFGFLTFNGTTKLIKGLFELIRKAVVVIYQIVSSYFNRMAEFRCDAYSASLGYALQLANVLALSASEAPGSGRRSTLTDVLYRSHPPIEKRICRLEKYIEKEMLIEHK